MRTPKWANRPLLLILLASLLSFLPGIEWGLPDGDRVETMATWAIDSNAPIQPLNEAYHMFTRRANHWPLYPLFHFVVIDVAYAPYMAYAFLTGMIENPSQEFPYGMKDPKGMAIDLVIIARLVSVLMALGIIIVVYLLTAAMFSHKAGLWAALFTAFIGSLSFYAKMSNMDVPYVFWSCLAFWQYYLAVRDQKLKHYLLFGAFAAVGVASKDQAYGFFVFAPFVMIAIRAQWEIAQNGLSTAKAIAKAAFSKPIWLTGLSVLVTYSITNNMILGGWGGFMNRVEIEKMFYDIREHHATGFYTSDLALLWRSTELVGQSLGLGTLLLSVAGIVYVASKKQWLQFSILSFIVAYYVSCIMVYEMVYSRYVLGLAILLTPFAGLVAAKLMEQRVRIRRVAFVGLAACVLLQLALVANLHLTLYKDSRYAVAEWIRENLPPGASIETQIRLQYSPRITDAYDLHVVGQTLGGMEGGEMIPSFLNRPALEERAPQYILILRGIGISGDPDTQHKPELVEYFDGLLSGEFGYQTLATFETPHFFSFRQIPGTRPTAILLGRGGAGEKLSD